MAPFSFSESIEFKKKNNIDLSEDDFFDFLKWGGMPQRYEEIDEQGLVNYFQSLYHSIIEKDVYKNHKCINKAAFENITNYIMMKTDRIFSPTSIAKFLLHITKEEFQSAEILMILLV